MKIDGFDSISFQAVLWYGINRQRWNDAYRNAASMEDRWKVIRRIYEQMMPAIMAAAQRHPRGRIDPYFVDWQFSPIERIAWSAIRALGTPLYPQVPADRFFIDFANPYHQVGLELDGRDYHDPERDAKRDKILRRQGWRIIRIPGRETYAYGDEKSEAERRIHDIDVLYFSGLSEDEKWRALDDRSDEVPYEERFFD